MDQILQLARLLGRQIQESEAYQKMNAAKEAADKDEQLQAAIGEFNLKRMDLNMAMGNENEAPDKDKIDRLNNEIKELYGSIMLNPNMQLYSEAQGAVSQMLEYVNTIISAAVNGEDPDAIDPTAANCSGDCSSCGGCH